MDIIEYFPNPFNSLDLVLFALVLLTILALLIYILKKILKPKPKSVKDRLKSLKIESKESLFKFSNLAQELENSALLSEILKELELYKFSKNSTKIPNELKQKIKRFIDNV